MATPLQHGPATQQPGLLTAGTGNDHPAKLAIRLRSATSAIQLG